MPNHTQETALLNVSWAKAFQTTGVNLVQMAQLTKLASSISAISIC